jgi:acyl-CoA dehydrogenase
VTDLSWPFFDERHRELARDLQDWCRDNLADRYTDDLDTECRTLVRELGSAGFLKLTVADGKNRPDVRSLAIARETLAYHSGLADFAFAMQGLGSGAISLFGTVEQKRFWLPRVASREAIPAFAMTELECGSDIATIRTTGRRHGEKWVIRG